MLSLLMVFSTIAAQAPDWEWASSVNSAGSEISTDAASDPTTGDLYIAGSWSSGLSEGFPSGTAPSTDFSSTYGGVDGFVAKYNNYGDLLWAFKVGGEGGDRVSAISVDPSGYLYITGTFGKGNGFFSGTSAVTGASSLTNTDRDDFFIAKYDTAGAFQWVRRSESDLHHLSGSALSALSSSVIVSGQNNGTAAFGPLALTATFGNSDIFVVKYDSSGAEQWLIQGGSDLDDYANGVAADGSGVYVAGNFRGMELELTGTGGNTVTSIPNSKNGNEEIFLLSCDPNGNFSWGRSVSGNGKDFCQDITLDGDTLCLTGSIDLESDFPSFPDNPVSSSFHQDIFISAHAKLNGNTGWAMTIPSTNVGGESGLSIVTDQLGNLSVTGNFKGDLSFPDGTVLTSEGAEDVFIASYTGAGGFRWAESAGSIGSDYGYGIAAGSSGSLYVAGAYDQEMILGGLTLPGNGGNNIFAAKINTSCMDAEVVPVAVVGDEGSVCGLEYQLSALPTEGTGIWSMVSGPGNVIFTPGETLEEVTTSADQYGSYQFQWEVTLEGCTVRDTAGVRFDRAPVVDAGPDQTLEFTFSTTLAAAVPDPGSGRWKVVSGTAQIADANDPFSLVTGLSPGRNEFSWTVENGVCAEASDQVVVTVTDITAPTVITPNGDGQNDYFVFPGLEQLTGCALVIYNRWGIEVYRTTDYQNGWEGRDQQNNELIPDTYFYILKLKSGRIIKGYVEIRR